MLKKILVAVDGSDASGRAVAMASEIGARSGSALILMHIPTGSDAQELARSRASFAEFEHWALSEDEMIQRVGEGVLRAAEVQARSAGVRDVTVVLVDGDPAHSIVDYVKSNDIDLVVTGRRGLGPASGLLLGSVSHKITQLVPCACMTVG